VPVLYEKFSQMARVTHRAMEAQRAAEAKLEELGERVDFARGRVGELARGVRLSRRFRASIDLLFIFFYLFFSHAQSPRSMGLTFVVFSIPAQQWQRVDDRYGHHRVGRGLGVAPRCCVWWGAPRPHRSQ
jgi:hypothetical protein